LEWCHAEGRTQEETEKQKLWEDRDGQKGLATNMKVELKKTNVYKQNDKTPQNYLYMLHPVVCHSKQHICKCQHNN
jgi:hypothetical protein